MTAGEDQPQPIVLDPAVVVVVVLIHLDTLSSQRIAPDLVQQLGAAPRTPQPVERSVAGDRRQPGAGSPRNTVARPDAERLRERLGGAVLGQIPVAGPADQGRDDPAPLVAEGPFDGALSRFAHAGASGLTSIM